MKFFAIRILLLVLAWPLGAFAINGVVNLSHYDLMRPDFIAMRKEGVRAVIHEASYPRFARDAYYASRNVEAIRAGLLWGAYHFGDATDPVRQADHFLDIVASSSPRIAPEERPAGVLLVLDFEKNGHYPGGTMRVDQAIAFVERIHQRTGNYPGIYCSEYRIRQMLYARGVSSAQREALAHCWLWVANYHVEPRATPPWNHWHLWQYTGDGKCDLRPREAFPKSVANIRKAERNMFWGNNAALETFWQQHAWVPSTNRVAANQSGDR